MEKERTDGSGTHSIYGQARPCLLPNFYAEKNGGCEVWVMGISARIYYLFNVCKSKVRKNLFSICKSEVMENEYFLFCTFSSFHFDDCSQ